MSCSIQCPPSPSPRSARPSPRIASRPRPRASRPNRASCRSRRPARYGRNQGWASNSKACVVSCSAIHVRNGTSGTSSARAVMRTFSSTNSSRPGAISADSMARSYWPSTRWPMNPSRMPSWRVVTQRLASAIVALASPPPGGMTWSRSSPSRRPMSAANDVVLARTQPARSTTSDRSTTPGSSVSSAALSAGTIRSMACR